MSFTFPFPDPHFFSRPTWVKITVTEGVWTGMYFVDRLKNNEHGLSTMEKDPMVLQIIAWLHHYLAGGSERCPVPVPYGTSGTPFQQEVWRATLAIPYGTTCSYQALARAIGSPKAFRAIGWWERNNS